MAFGDDFTNPPPNGACCSCCCKGCPNLEEVIRSSIREEIQEFVKLLSPHLPSLQIAALPSTSRSLPNQAESPVSRLLQLHFVGVFPDTLFTFTDIEIDGAPLQVELRDSSGFRVGDSPGSSVKVKLYALSDMEEDTEGWTEEDYNRNSIEQRKDKGALLGGDYEIPMREGVAVFSNVRFTDNSSWTKTKKFKLAAVVKGLYPGVVVSGAVSKAFRVKERRGLACQKHGAPSLEDEVWHLVNIGKDGKTHQRLAKENVKTVKDFLQLYHTNAKKLQKILQFPEKKWAAIVKHAGLCSGSSENHIYKAVKDNIDQPFKGQSGQSHGILADSQKVDRLRHIVCEKRSELPKTNCLTNQISGQAETIHSSTITLPNLESTPSCSSTIMLANLEHAPSCSSTVEHSVGHAHAIAANQGEQVLPVNSSPGLMQYSVEPDFDLCLGEEFWLSNFPDPLLTDSTVLPEKMGAAYDTSANETASSKLRVACLVKLAVTAFTIPVQQDPAPPRKKQKIQ